MARLSDIIKLDEELELELEEELSLEESEEESEELESDLHEEHEEDKQVLIEALETLIEMIEDDSLNIDEIEVLDEAIYFIAEDSVDDAEDFEEELTEAIKLKKMSAKAKQKAKKYRMKNKGKIKIAAKKRKMKDRKLAKKKAACKKKGFVYSKRKGGCARAAKRR